LNNASEQESHISVHLALYPSSNKASIDPELEQRMDYAQRISSLILSLRKKDRLRVRQPLQKILLPILDEGFKDQVEQVKDLILSEVNIKDIEYITDTTGVINKRIKANFKTLGRKLGKDMKAAAAVINTLDQDAIATIEKTGIYNLQLESSNYELTLEDFEISADEIPGWQVASDGDITLALDVTVTPDLKKEGIARELVNRIQNIRKSSDFEVTDRINVTIQDHPEVIAALAAHSEYIAVEVLADNINHEPVTSGETTELVDDISVVIQVTKA